MVELKKINEDLEKLKEKPYTWDTIMKLASLIEVKKYMEEHEHHKNLGHVEHESLVEYDCSDEDDERLLHAMKEYREECRKYKPQEYAKMQRFIEKKY